MLEFKKVELSDKEWIRELLGYSDFRGCEYTFGNMFMWQDIYDIKICRYKDFILEQNSGGFLFPAGRGNILEAVNTLRSYCAQNGKTLFFSSMNKTGLEFLKEHFGDEIDIMFSEDYFDYIYNRSDLETLSGKKYHAKRNHINRFCENNWSYEAITADNIAECEEMNDRWCEENECMNDADKSLEICAVKQGMKNFFELGFSGGLLRVDGAVKAFTFGERANSDTFNVHVEKAMRDIQGAYAVINNCFVKENCSEYLYINREEDMGAENLRKAKRSYYPAFMEEKFKVKFKK